MVRPEWNGVIQNHRMDTQVERSRVERVPKETDFGHVILIASINIRSGRVGSLETGLRALRKGNIGIRVLQKTKLVRGIHTLLSSDYKVWAIEAGRRHWGGIYIVMREDEGWKVEGAHIFGPNVVFFTVVSGNKLWYVVGAYVPPKNVLAVH